MGILGDGFAEIKIRSSFGKFDGYLSLVIYLFILFTVSHKCSQAKEAELVNGGEWTRARETGTVSFQAINDIIVARSCYLLLSTYANKLFLLYRHRSSTYATVILRRASLLISSLITFVHWIISIKGYAFNLLEHARFVIYDRRRVFL